MRLFVTLTLSVAACASAPEVRSEPEPVVVAQEDPHPPVIVEPPPKPIPTLTLSAVGDIMLGSTFPYPDGRDLPPADDRPAGLMTPFVPLLQSTDLAFGNLEGAIVAATDAAAKPKCNGLTKGCFAFRMPPELAPQLKAAGFDLMSMANNHATDFGEPGRDSSRAILDGLGIKYSGRRGDIARVEVRGLKVSMVALSNYDHSYLLNDITDATKVIAAEAAACDVLIVSFHGGAEGPDRMHVPFGHEYFLGRSRGDLRVFARAAVDAGADIVIGHGPHVVRAMEIYKERLIAYSLGNFSTYKRFNLTGPNGLAVVLEATLAGDGRFVSGRLHALKQLGLGGPTPDPDGEALPLIRSLSREDFPETGIDIDPEGRMYPFGTPPPPASPRTLAGPLPGLSHLAEVHPHMKRLALALHERASALGAPFRVIFGYTEYKPRTRPGPGGMATWHQFGLAFDVLIADRRDIADGKRHFEEDAAAWKTLGGLAEELGLVWGGSWRSSYDPFHFEWHPGDDSTISASDLKRLLAKAGRDGKDYRAAWSLYEVPDPAIPAPRGSANP